MGNRWHIKTPEIAQNCAEQVKACAAQPGRYVVYIEPFSQSRSDAQNAISHAWYRQIANEIEGITALTAKCVSKLHCGVPLLRAESDDFRQRYDNLIKNRFNYEEKIKLMEWFPVTSLMTVKQMSEYLERVIEYWAAANVTLEFPNYYDPADYREAQSESA